MSLDAYSLCPGGTGKKIKFCCGDYLAELEKIDRMLEGEQFVACLQLVDRLLQDGRERACLLATRGLLLRMTDQVEAAVANAARFVERHPANPAALAESAILTAATQGGAAGMPHLQRAMAASDDGIELRVYEALGMVANFLLADGEWFAGRALLQLQLAVGRDDRVPLETLMRLNGSSEVPLLFKEDVPTPPCPADAPWKGRFEEALQPVRLGHWQGAADRLSALAAEVTDSPAIWGHLAMVRSWLADAPGCIEALRRFAALPEPLEDAVEAAAIALLLSEDPLGDLVDVRSLTYAVRDPERFQEAILSEARVVPVSFDPAAYADGENPPPKGAYMLLDRPTAESAENLAPEGISCVLGQALFFGRQTDREARLEVHGVTATDQPRVQSLLQSLAGGTLETPAEETIGRLSASQEMFQRKWRLPRDVDREQVSALSAEHERRTLLERWPQSPLGALGGRTPREATADPASRIALLAALLVLETWNERAGRRVKFNELRAALGLPTLDPVDPLGQPIGKLRLTRLERLIAEKLGDDDLLLAFRRAVAYNAAEANRRLAQAVTARPSLAKKEEYLRAFRVLAETAPDLDRALGHVDEGRKAAEAAGHSSASWDLLELSYRFARREPADIERLINHIHRQHIREPGVAEALHNFLVQVGLLRPDGTPHALPEETEPVPAAGEPSGEPGKLWTPDDAQGGGGGKLWVPE